MVELREHGVGLQGLQGIQVPGAGKRPGALEQCDGGLRGIEVEVAQPAPWPCAMAEASIATLQAAGFQTAAQVASAITTALARKDVPFA